jgi:hypothetical protein
MYTIKETDQIKGWFHEPKKLQWIFHGLTVFMGLIFLVMTIYISLSPGSGEFLFMTAIFIFLLIYILLLSCKLDKVIG